MADLASVRVLVRGHVQQVFFRAFVATHTAELCITGFTRNLPSGDTVEVVAEGEREKLEKLIGHLRIGPPNARVDRVETNWGKYSGGYSAFVIRR